MTGRDLSVAYIGGTLLPTGQFNRQDAAAQQQRPPVALHVQHRMPERVHRVYQDIASPLARRHASLDDLAIHPDDWPDVAR